MQKVKTKLAVIIKSIAEPVVLHTEVAEHLSLTVYATLTL